MNSQFKITKCWSDGSICERSKRRLPEEIEQKKDTVEIRIESTFNNQIMSNGETIYSRDTNNRREDTYIKIASREMFNKVNQNPFLLGHDYVVDIGIQDQYLKPAASGGNQQSQSQKKE